MDTSARSHLAIVAALFAFAGCGTLDTGDEAPDSAAPGRATSAIGVVEVTNYPLAYVVDRIAGPLLEVRFRAAGEADPAYWRPNVDQVVEMQPADLIVINGAGYERWLGDVSLPSSRIVDTTAAVHDRLIALDEAVTHSHGLEGEHEHVGTAFTTWLDPTLLIEQARAAERALAGRWPEHASTFSEGLGGLAADLEALDAELAAATSGAAERPVVFSHPVYQYLQRRYDLAGDSVHWEPDTIPNDAAWAELDHLRGHGQSSWMIWEAEPLPETRDRLAGVGMESAVVEPRSTPPSSGDLLDALRRNAVALSEVYGNR